MNKILRQVSGNNCSGIPYLWSTLHILFQQVLKLHIYL